MPRCNKVGGLGQGLPYSLLLGVEAVKSRSMEGAPHDLDLFKGLDWLVVVGDSLLSHLKVLVLELYFVSVVT